jgi:sec-independent protein translocase protein TatB
MLDVGFSELLLIAVVALVVIGPKDLPVVVRHVAKFIRDVRDVIAGLKTQMNQVVEELGVDDLRQNMTTIIDLEGKPQQAFDVRELEGIKRNTAAHEMLPLTPAADTAEKP